MAFGVTQYVMAGMGVFGYTAYINTETNNASGMVISIVISALCVVAGFVSEFLFYKEAPKKESTSAHIPTPTNTTKAGEIIAAPVNGEVKALSEVEDEAFSTGALGQGLAILPKEGKIYAPVNGEISTFFPTGHAIGLLSDNGAEVLIHVGMDTVKLDGKGFTPRAEQGAKVRKGDLLLEFDIDFIQAQGYSIVTPMIITNTDDYAEVVPTNAKEVKHGESAIQLL